ncbi:MAG: hypothetical protein CRN43_13620, partial [Candidatus Nephrothrix sp. EaCA]
YNGNISWMETNLSKFGKQAMLYKYDQLNRITKSKSLAFGNNAYAARSGEQKYDEDYSYDANGNILTLNRKDDKAAVMDDFNYSYYANTNRLLKHKTAGGAYEYDAIGNLIKDNNENLSIAWTPNGKVRSVAKPDTTVYFRYDATGNRIAKIVSTPTKSDTTAYVRDASGNVMTVYDNRTAAEAPIYGSSRIGEYMGKEKEGYQTFNLRKYELSNHLGNVLAVISDKVNLYGHDNRLDSARATVMSASDYYPFGLPMKGRQFSGSFYRFGFNGQEKDDEIRGKGNSISFDARMYATRFGRWLSMDALASKYPSVSPFVFALNTPIMAKDPDGNLVIFINGQHAGTGGTAAYWGEYAKDVMKSIGDQSARYVDGALGGWRNTGEEAVKGGLAGWRLRGWVGALAGATFKVLSSSNVSIKVRMAAGEAQGMKDAADIIANLKEGETIKIVTHSMGAGFSRGYTKGILKYAKAHGQAGRVAFEYELDVNAFQGGDLPIDENVRQIQNKTGGLDGGKSLTEALRGNSVPTVDKVPDEEDTTDPSDADKGHAIDKMSDTNIPYLGNGGSAGSVEQGSNNKKKP